MIENIEQGMMIVGIIMLAYTAIVFVPTFIFEYVPKWAEPLPIFVDAFITSLAWWLMVAIALSPLILLFWLVGMIV